MSGGRIWTPSDRPLSRITFENTIENSPPELSYLLANPLVIINELGQGEGEIDKPNLSLFTTP